MLYGTDQNYAASTNTRVYIPVASSRENRLVDGLLAQHSQSGAHTAITATTLATTGTITSGGLVTATNGLNVSGGTTTLPNNAILAPMLDVAAITLGYAQITSNFTTPNAAGWVAVPGLSVNVTIPAGGRRVKITAFGRDIFKTASGVIDIGIWDGAVGTGTQIGGAEPNLAASTAVPMHVIAVPPAPATGAKTYSVGINPNTANNVGLEATTVAPAFILVELI